MPVPRGSDAVVPLPHPAPQRPQPLRPRPAGALSHVQRPPRGRPARRLLRAKLAEFAAGSRRRGPRAGVAHRRLPGPPGLNPGHGCTRRVPRRGKLTWCPPASRTTPSSATPRPPRSWPRRLDRLVCVPRFDSGAVLRRAARQPRARPLAARPGRRGPARSTRRTATTRWCSRPSSTPTTATCASSTSCRSATATATSSAIVEGVSRPRADAHGAGRPLRLRLDRPVGRATATARLSAIAGPDALRPPHAGADPTAPATTTVAEFEVERGRARAVRADLAPVARRRPPRARRPAAPAPDTERWWRDWVGPVRPTDGEWRDAVHPLAHHAQGAHLRADRRHRRRADHVAARVARRRAQLGLPLLLAARRHVHPRRAHDRRLPRRGARPGATGCCAPWPATRPSSRSCTASRASGASPSSSSTGCPATRAPRRCASATPPSTSSSSTCTARSWTLHLYPPAVPRPARTQPRLVDARARR